MGYFGSKATSGPCQPLIAMMSPHGPYIETHIGAGTKNRVNSYETRPICAPNYLHPCEDAKTMDTKPHVRYPSRHKEFADRIGRQTVPGQRRSCLLRECHEPPRGGQS